MKKRRPKTAIHRHERGMMLVVAMMLAVFMAVVTVPFLQRFQQLHRMTEKDFDEGSAQALAEAGAERALWEINSGDGTWTGWSGTTTKTLTLTDVTAAGGDVIGSVAISVFNPISANPVIESTATVAHIGTNSLASTVRLVLEPRDPPLFGHGLFGNEGVVLDEYALVDSFDSRHGPYGWGNVGSEGHIGTNSVAEGAIYLGPNSEVRGDAVVGFEGDPETGIHQELSALLTGQKKAQSEPKEWPPVQTPAGLPNQGDLTIPANGHYNHNSSVQIGNLSIGQNATLHLISSCDLNITGNLTMEHGSVIRVEPNAQVRLYVGGNVAVDHNSFLQNESHDPSHLVLYGAQTSPTTVDLMHNSSIYAALYFPNAILILDDHVNVLGAVIAKYVVIGNHSNIHYDRGLGVYQAGLRGTGGFRVKSWQEKL